MSDDDLIISPPAKRVRKSKFVTARPCKSAETAPKPRKFVELCGPTGGGSRASRSKTTNDTSPASADNYTSASTANSTSASRSKPNRSTTSSTKQKYRGPKLSKVSWNRNDCVKELRCTIHGQLQSLDEALTDAGVPFHFKPLPSRFDGVVAYIVLERETKTTWNHHFQAYVDGDLHTEREKWALVILDTETCPVFKGEHALFAEIEKYIGKECLYIAEGYHKLFKKQQTAYNRAFQRRIRDELNNKENTDPLPPAPSIDSHIQSQIQIQRTGRRVVYPKDRKKTITWIMNLLKDLALVRYIDAESQKLASLKIKSQTDPKDVMRESLMFVPGVGKRMAENHCQWFESLGDVFAKYEGGGELEIFMNSFDPNECL